MFDIVEIFPTANEMKKMSSEDFELFFFEIDLRQAFQMLAAGATAGVKQINYMYPSKKVLEFLEDKGYTVDRKSENKAIVSW